MLFNNKIYDSHWYLLVVGTNMQHCSCTTIRIIRTRVRVEYTAVHYCTRDLLHSAVATGNSSVGSSAVVYIYIIATTKNTQSSIATFWFAAGVGM